MTKEEKKTLCKEYFMNLAEKLRETHELVKSCNQDETMYIIPKGTIDQLTYTSKPDNSYRYSDHWNWYANTKKCEDPFYIQCHCIDLPRAKRRLKEGYASKPVFGICVAYCKHNDVYHTIYGEKFNTKDRTWSFVG